MNRNRCPWCTDPNAEDYSEDLVPTGWWELAAGHTLGRRSRVRSSGGTRPVQLVAVRVVDTSHRARRRFWPCSCDRPMNAEHAPACDWWNNRPTPAGATLAPAQLLARKARP